MKARLQRVEATPYLEWWRETYGGPAGLLDGLACFQGGKYAVWIASVDLDTIGMEHLVEGAGIPFARIGRRHWKPAGPAVRHFGAAATRGVFEATRKETAHFLAGETLPPRADDPRFAGTPRGYAIVRLRGVPIGCGLWCAAGLESNVPKGRRIEAVDLPPSGGSLGGLADL